MTDSWRNQLYFGDNFDVLREHSGEQGSLPQQAARTLGTVRYVNRLVSLCAQALAHGLEEARKVVGGCRRQVIRRPSR